MSEVIFEGRATGIKVENVYGLKLKDFKGEAMGAAHTKIKKKGKRKKSIVDKITGIIKIDPKIAKEIIDMEVWDYDPEFEELLKLKNKR